MGCMIDKDLIEQTISFHGHTCPGLAIGIRASELAMGRLDMTGAKSVLCVVETDMCGVDAIQFLTTCTFGKGNLIHKDFGKAGFTFFDREESKGFRAVFIEKGKKSKDKKARTKEIMDADLDSLFKIEDITAPPVKPAKILQSIECEKCKEMTMESRIRRFDNKYL
ncbi:MAG: formylmethanofuran dehydrogenase, partial [Desulfobacteraceae bacterium]|nr:formylmethanofuran dehydrogenase [Desulfobacteraceae bacterium]